MATATRTVRIKPETHQRLQRLARETNRSLPDVLEEAIGDYERRRFLEGLNEDFGHLRADSAAWQEEREERALWEGVSLDNLQDEPPYPPAAMLTEEERVARGKAEQAR